MSKKAVSLWICCIFLLSSLTASGVAFQVELKKGVDAFDEGQVNYYAVLVGCSDYENDEYDLPKGFLPPVSVEKMSVLYETLIDAPNWNQENIVVLINENASRQRIIDTLLEMSIRVDDNDIFVFSWCGHGTRVEDIDGDEAVFDSDDIFDEAICPYDIRKGGINCISDDELDSLFSQIACGSMLCFFECCFSGGLVDKKADSVDVDNGNRIVITSTKPDCLGRMSLVFGWPLLNAFSLGLAQMSRDRNGDGWISVQEAFSIAKPIFCLESLTVWAASLFSVYIQYRRDNERFPFLYACSSVYMMYWMMQSFSLLMYGAAMRNYASIDDGCDGELLLVQC